MTGLSFVSLALLLVTAVEPSWIEHIFGVEPDGGDGSAEVIVTLVLVMVTVANGVATVVSWRRALRR
jgi:hypothetical protein